MTLARFPLSLLAASLVAGLLHPSASGDEPPLAPKPIPGWQIVPQPGDQFALEWQGREISRYHYGAQLKRPFLYPLIGPAGKSLTRLGHPHDPVSHSHHNSVWISHNDVDKVDFWGDRKDGGQIVHQRVVGDGLVEGDEWASVLVQNAWKTADGKVLLHELRKTTFVAGSDKQWSVDIEIELTPAGPSVTLGKSPFGLIGVRMAKPIGVKDGGGRIRNSAGGRDEAECFWKSAKWVDYSGQIVPGAIEGVTLMDDPRNPNHPAIFHVRDDGWMGASVSHAAPLEISKEKPLRVRYGLSIHAGLRDSQRIDDDYRRFAARGAETMEAKVK